MAELYFKLKLIGNVIVLGFFALVFMFLLVKSIIISMRARKIDQYLTSIGYKRELISTASVGTNHTYGYTRNCGEIIYDRELKNISLKQVKQKYQ